MRIYIETSIPSFYYETRTDERSQRVRNWTRRWWDERRGGHQLVTSLAALAELARGEHPRQDEKIALAESLRRVPITAEVDDTAARYIERKVMPDEELGDAYHFAAASHANCDVLLTNNVAHLANPNKLDHIRQVNEELGLCVPALKTPQQMIEDDSDGPSDD